MSERFDGWLFDGYPEERGMRVWTLDAEGRHRDFLDLWGPAFFVGERGLSRASRLLKDFPSRRVERLELFENKTIPVLEVRTPPRARDKLVAKLKDLGLDLYSADMHLVQTWHYEREHFPLAFGSFEVEDGRLLAFELKDDLWAVDYALPPLRTAHLALSGGAVSGKVDPNHALRGSLLFTADGATYELEGSTEEQLESLARHLAVSDPDVITSEWGDSILLPGLELLSQRHNIPIPFSRDASRGMGKRGERTFYTYGRTVYQNSARYLHGRWHLDNENSFMLRETGTDGLYEIARIARIPVQRAARCTIGTSLSSMQMAVAVKDGVLIPMDKQQAEEFRSADALLVADKGGLAYEPEVGWHQRVAEYDFVSMYPAMMVQHNISPETVNCPCCPDNQVPEIGHHLCRERQGLVPKVLAPILEKRARYKVLAKSANPLAATYKRRATAHKWILVTCFGYLGFKNARFGKIESHECVTAWGRETLLRAKESVERRGLHLIHALVDAVWVQLKPDTDLEAVRLAIEAEAGCSVGLEGVYKWLRFCPSKADKLSGVPGRYFGCFEGGELKLRGIATRRRDTPKYLKALQKDLLDRMARADGLAGCRSALAELEEIAADYRQRLKEGGVTADELAITFHLSREPGDYVHDTLSAVAAKQLQASGARLHAGETVRYIIASAGDKVKDWRTMPVALLTGPLEYDRKKYLELLDRAAEEIMGGLCDRARQDRQEPGKL